jgi:heme oxygenase (biliverdin-IX-beta and delta-forming)
MPMSSRRDEPPQISLNGSPSVRDSLRQATHAAHVRLNHHPLLQNLTRPSQTLEGYCRVLAAYARFYRPLEDWIVASLAALDLDFCYESRRKLPWLLADLDYFEIQPGSPSGPTALAPLITDRGGIGQLAGVLYSIEGSSLGGQVIVRHLHSHFGFTAETGARFFHGYGAETGTKWAEVCQFIESLAADHDRISMAQSAALAVFEGLESTLNDCA